MKGSYEKTDLAKYFIPTVKSNEELKDQTEEIINNLRQHICEQRDDNVTSAQEKNEVIRNLRNRVSELNHELEKRNSNIFVLNYFANSYKYELNQKLVMATNEIMRLKQIIAEKEHFEETEINDLVVRELPIDCPQSTLLNESIKKEDFKINKLKRPSISVVDSINNSNKPHSLISKAFDKIKNKLSYKQAKRLNVGFIGKFK